MRILKPALAALMLASLPVAKAQAAPDPGAVISDAIGAMLQADGPKERSLLQSLDAADLTPKRVEVRTCMLARLDGSAADPKPVADPFVQKLLETYRTYWREAANAPGGRDAAEQRLATDLATLLNRSDLKDVDAAEPILTERLAKAGFHSTLGRTGLLRELMLWSRQEDRPYTVALPEGTHVTHVFLLNDFASMGWSSYFSCEHTGTGGWTKPEGLYAIVPNYQSLEDETFKVNFLAHETQHFADITHFPNLADWEKEYRAKLTELSLADTTREHVLGAFALNQGDDPADPHAYADKRVLANMRRRLGLADGADLKAVPGDQLRAAAKAELMADSAAREGKR